MGKINYTRGTTYTITHTYQKNGIDSTDGRTLLFTVKSVPNDTSADDSTAVIKKNIPMTGATTVFTIAPSDIADTVAPAKLHYDIRVIETSGAIYDVDNGTFTLTATATNRES